MAFIAMLLGLLILLVVGVTTGPAGLLVGMLLGMLPVPLWVMLARWLDRYEPEPPWMLAVAFFWGATVAVFFAGIFNDVNEALAAAAIGKQAAGHFGTVFSAPFVEESLKALALLLLFLWKKNEFDDIVDGVVYAAMVGLGFAMTENFLYYGRALSHEGLGGVLATFLLRGVFSPLSHPLFTSMTGIGLGWARQSDNRLVKLLAPPAGYLCAILLHFAWNGSASQGATFLIVYPLVMLPILAGVLLLVYFTLRKEGEIIRRHLLSDVRNGLLPEEELDRLCTVSGRRLACKEAYARGGAAARKIRAELNQVAAELAFQRRRIARSLVPRDDSASELEARYVELLSRLRRV
jgi:RsiW-degrading membrane proteinase PrsW (M82 family)